VCGCVCRGDLLIDQSVRLSVRFCAVLLLIEEVSTVLNKARYRETLSISQSLSLMRLAYNLILVIELSYVKGHVHIVNSTTVSYFFLTWCI